MDSFIDDSCCSGARCGGRQPAARQKGDHMPVLRKKTAKPGDFVIAQRGGIVGIVFAVVKDKRDTRYKIASGNCSRPFWVFHDELSGPRRGNFEDLVRLYDSLVQLFDRMAGLVNRPGTGDLGERVQANIFDLITAVWP
jgi:hypothetical protein